MDDFVDRGAAEDRGDEQLMLQPLVEREPVEFQMTSSTTPGEIVRWLEDRSDWEPAAIARLKAIEG